MYAESTMATTTTRRHAMPAYEIHIDTYHVEDMPVIEAKDAYEAAIMFAGRFAPCRIIRLHPEREGDTFRISPTDSDDGVEVEVYEYEGEVA